MSLGHRYLPSYCHCRCHILCSLGSSSGCFFFVRQDYFLNPSSNPDYSLLVLKQAQCLEFSIFIRLFKSFWALLIHDISAIFNSSGMRGPSRPLSAFLLRRIFSANCFIHVVTRISLRQLEKFFTPITFPTSAFETGQH